VAPNDLKALGYLRVLAAEEEINKPCDLVIGIVLLAMTCSLRKTVNVAAVALQTLMALAVAREVVVVPVGSPTRKVTGGVHRAWTCNLQGMVLADVVAPQIQMACQ